jgi:hypothetical protein
MPNTLITVERMLGDRQIPISAKLVRNGAAVNLTGKTVKFHMVNKASQVVVNEQAATIVSASEGTVSYALSANDVDESGEFYGWFIVLDGSSLTDTFPHDGNKFQITIHNRPTS